MPAEVLLRKPLADLSASPRVMAGVRSEATDYSGGFDGTERLCGTPASGSGERLKPSPFETRFCEALLRTGSPGGRR
jgi:hypothetical protein